MTAHAPFVSGGVTLGDAALETYGVAEIRCYMRDPDGYVIEVGQATGLLSGHLAAKRPEDLLG